MPFWLTIDMSMVKADQNLVSKMHCLFSSPSYFLMTFETWWDQTGSQLNTGFTESTLMSLFVSVLHSFHLPFLCLVRDQKHTQKDTFLLYGVCCCRIKAIATLAQAQGERGEDAMPQPSRPTLQVTKENMTQKRMRGVS